MTKKRKIRRPLCSIHPEEFLKPLRSGWFCESCEKPVVRYEEWPGPSEKLCNNLQVENLPTFLSAKIVDADKEEHEVVRLWSLCEIAEVLLRVLTAIGVIDIEKKCGKIPDTLAKRFLEENRILRPTFGGWLELLKEVSSIIDEKDFVPELKRDTKDVIIPLLRDPQNGLLNLRNDLAHGGGFNRQAAMYIVGPHTSFLRESLSRMRWLSDIEFVVQCDGHETILRGSDPNSLSNFKTTIKESNTEIGVRRGSLYRSLWPICACLIPTGSSKATPSIYVRGDKKRLEHLPIIEAFSLEELRGEAVKRFRELFRFQDYKSLLGILQNDFERDFQEIGNQVVGRSDEIDKIMNLVKKSSRPGVIWIEGKPGVGKSAVMSKLALRLKGIKNNIVLTWRFRLGDPRCTRSHFLSYSIKTLLKKLRMTAKEVGDDPDVLIKEFEELLQKTVEKRVIAIIDGIDELERVDPDFIDFPFKIDAPNIVWVCAGRPTKKIKTVFEENRCKHAFPLGGLRPMEKEDIDTWMKSRIPTGQRAQLIRDESQWIKEVVNKSEGLPQYIQLLINELEHNKIGVGSILPMGLDQFWDKLLADTGIDDVTTLLPKLIAIITLSVEAPSSKILYDVLVCSGDIDQNNASSYEKIVEGVLERAQTLIDVEYDAEGKEKYYPSHESLRDHLKETDKIRNTRNIVRKALCSLAKDPTICSSEETRHSVFTFGIRQLLADEMIEDAKLLMCSSEYLYKRITSFQNYKYVESNTAMSELLEDFKRIKKRIKNDENFEKCFQFMRRYQHKIIKGGAIMFFQLVMNEPRDFILRESLNKWVVESSTEVPWLELIALDGIDTAPSIVTMEIRNSIKDMAIHPKFRYLVVLCSYRDATVWDTQTGTQLGTIENCKGNNLFFAKDGRMFAADDEYIRIWEMDDEGNATFIKDYNMPSRIVRIFGKGEGEIVALIRCNERVQVVEIDSQEIIFDMPDPDPNGEVMPLPGNSMLSAREHFATFEYWIQEADGKKEAPINVCTSAIIEWEKSRLWFPYSMGVLVCVDTKTLKGIDALQSDYPTFSMTNASGGSPEVGIFAFGAMDDLIIFDVNNRRSTVIQGAHSNGIEHIAVSQDGDLIVTSGHHENWIIQVWDIDNLFSQGTERKIENEVENLWPVYFLKIDPEKEQVLCILQNGIVKYYDLTTGSLIRSFRLYLRGVSSSDYLLSSKSDLSCIAVAYDDECDVKEYNLVTGEERFFCPTSKQYPYDDLYEKDGIEKVAYSSGEKAIQALTKEGLVLRWDAQTGEPLDSAPWEEPGTELKGIHRKIIIDPEPEPPLEFFHIDHPDHIRFLEVESTKSGEIIDEAEKLKVVSSVHWVHDRPITAATATVDGNVVFGDDKGSVLFLRKRKGVVFEPIVVK